MYCVLTQIQSFQRNKQQQPKSLQYRNMEESALYILATRNALTLVSLICGFGISRLLTGITSDLFQLKYKESHLAQTSLAIGGTLQCFHNVNKA